ncbi:uncharacterized protein EV154DRAFT_573355 [Mucor mucedo]|uniref:uncharacterized protein n=1 Tax=Mucor mucedo TaxID=29922 RepID=UPI002220C577|nr:uncharacterized protein EV154DRAFT_573355 [Mucor mucedo]KAI7895558.1 hypothetical protein EV154DRAFT_573355 [Mucor mucedo]
MNTFESLPHEIWDIIMFYVGDHAKKSQVMAVNKKWYNLYLSLAYTAPVIDLNSCPSKFNGFFNSPFNPGQYTTSITLQHFGGDTEYYADITESKLYRLMMQTPHVKEVEFDQIKRFDTRYWDYFYKALKAANTWKLHKLPNNWYLSHIYKQAILVHATYWKCVKHLKHSISSVRLIKTKKPKMMNFRFLNQFTALRSLNITKGLLKRVYDLDILLQQVSQLEEIEVDFSDTSFVPDFSRNGGMILGGEYPNIKTIIFHSFVFQTDHQACIFYTNFTGLQKLHITGIQNELILRPETEMKFFTMLSSLLDYNFGLRGSFIGKSDFVSRNCMQVNHALLSGRRRGDNPIPICVEKSILFPDGAIRHTIWNDHIAARRILLGLGPNIQQLELSDIKDEHIQDSLEVLFSNQHKKLRYIVFQRLNFTMLTNANLVFTGCIDSVQFEVCTLSEQALQFLLACFTNLRKVHFKACVFSDSFKHTSICVTMPKTDIQQLCITYQRPPNNELGYRHKERWNRAKPRVPFPLVSITLINEGTTKYYHTKYEVVPVVMETTEKEFLQLRENATRFVPCPYVIAIQAKSIRELTIMNHKTHPSTDIHMNL